MIPSIAFAVLAAMTADAAVIPGSLEARQLTIGPSVMAVGTNYNGWTSLGCWQDTFNSGSQILNTYQYQPLMTFNSCSSFCTKGGFKYMGLSNGQWCYCDNQINTYNGAGYATSSDKCTLGCAGELTFNCGAFWTNTMFQTTTSYQADQAAKASSVAAYSASSAAAYSASSLAAYSASAGAQYSASSLAAYSRSTSAAAYSQSSLAAYSQAAAASAAAASVAAYSASSLAAYSQGVAASAAAASAAAYSQSSLAAYSQSAAAAYSQSSLAAYSQGVAASAAAASAAASSAAAYSRSTSAAAYSASSLAAYSQGVAASAAAASAAAYSQSSLAAYSQGVAASAAAASVAAYSASVAAYSQGVAASAAAASASAYSASSAAAASAVAASAAAYSAGIASASAFSASAAAYSASSSAAAAAATTIPSPWVAASASCIAEGTTGRALTGDSTSGSDMTYSKCLNYCSGKGYSIAGLEYSRECYCGNSLLNGASLTNTSPNCNMACAGSSSTTCGGPGALTVFVVPSKITGLNTDLTVKTAALPTGWSVASTSCVAEGTTGRALTGASTAAADMTGAKCASFCADKGFRFAGTEYGQECYCGNDLTNGASLTKPSQSCNMACAGDANSICGGPGALNLYTNPNVTPVTTSSGSGGNGGFTGPVSNNIPFGWSAAPSACIQEVSGRALTGASTANDKMTIGTCLTFCQSKGFQYAGLEYGSECYCGNELTNGAALSKTANQCTMACSGDATSTCGGPNSIQLFQNPSLAPVTPKASVVGGYTAAGCIQEVSGRALTGLRVDYADMTQEKCVAACSAAGFKMAGIEYGQECYCGNSLVNGASTTLTSGQCVMDCPGNSSQKCGGPNAITLFTA